MAGVTVRRWSVAVLLLALAGCGSPHADPQRPSASPAPTAGASAGSLTRTAAGPVGLTVDARGRVWVANADAGTVSRLDAAGHGADLSIRVGDAPLRLAATDDAVWVSVFGDGTVRRLDDRTGRVTDTLDVGAEPEGLTAAFGSLWVVLQSSAEVLRVDLRSAQVERRIHVGTAPRLVVADDHWIWVSDFATGRVLRVDPVTGRVRRSARLCSGPQGMVAAGGALWVACTPDDLVVRLDRTELRRTARLPVAGSPDSLTAGPHGQVLVAVQQGPALAVIDPGSLKVQRRAAFGHQDQLHDRANIDIAYAARRAWVSSYLEGGVYRSTP